MQLAHKHEDAKRTVKEQGLKAVKSQQKHGSGLSLGDTKAVMTAGPRSPRPGTTVLGHGVDNVGQPVEPLHGAAAEPGRGPVEQTSQPPRAPGARQKERISCSSAPVTQGPGSENLCANWKGLFLQATSADKQTKHEALCFSPRSRPATAAGPARARCQWPRW